MSLILDLNCLVFFGFGDDRHFHWRLWRLISGSYSKIQDSSPVMTLCSKSGSVWRMLENVLTHLHAPLLLVIVQKFRHHLRIDLPHTQIFRDNLPHAVTVDFQLICYHSNSQLMIAMHHLLHALNIVRSPARWRPSTPRVIFHIFVSLLKPLVPLKDTWAWHCLISVHFLQHSECIRWSFSQSDQKLQIDTLLNICSLDIMSYIDATVDLYSTHSSHSTLSPGTFLTHLVRVTKIERNSLDDPQMNSALQSSTCYSRIRLAVALGWENEMRRG